MKNMTVTRAEVATLLKLFDEVDALMGGLKRTERTLFNRLLREFHGEQAGESLIAYHKKRNQ
jgi:hypothetical protein